MMNADCASSKPSPAWREGVVSEANRLRVNALDAPTSTLPGALTLTRLTAFGTLSRQAGEGFGRIRLKLIRR
jgi:hypothetical protein